MPRSITGIKCFTDGRNTGRAGCPYKPGLIKADILVPWDFAVTVDPLDTDADILDNLMTALATIINVDNYQHRAQLIGRYISFEDKSEAPNMQKQGYGGQTKTNDGKTIHEHTYDNGGQDYHNAVRTFDGKVDTYKVIRVENTDTLRMCKVSDPANPGALLLQGIELEDLNVYPYKAANYTTEAEYRLGLTFADNDELNANMFAIATGQNILAILEALQVIDVSVGADASTGTAEFPLFLKTINGNVNLSDTLGDVIADPTAFAFTNGTSGATVDVLSVSRNPISKVYTVTLDVMSAGYNVGDNAVGGLAPVSALEALDAEYFEGNNTVALLMN